MDFVCLSILCKKEELLGYVFWSFAKSSNISEKKCDFWIKNPILEIFGKMRSKGFFSSIRAGCSYQICKEGLSN